MQTKEFPNLWIINVENENETKKATLDERKHILYRFHITA